MKKTIVLFASFLAMLAFVATGCWSVKTNVSDGTKGEIKAEAKPVPKNLLNDHEWVDLGLPSGLRWATCNVGAARPEEYGDYFAWGETSPKDTYSKENYKFYSDGVTKYCGDERNRKGRVDTLTELQPEDDAATANWGEGWRMPTSDEAGELISNCRMEPIQIKGIWVLKFIGPNGNSIIIPFADTCVRDRRAGGKDYYASCWTSSLRTKDRYWAMVLDLQRIGNPGELDIKEREIGCTVRPVCLPPQN